MAGVPAMEALREVFLPLFALREGAVVDAGVAERGPDVGVARSSAADGSSLRFLGGGFLIPFGAADFPVVLV